MGESDEFDIVLLNGRVMDPESGLDDIRNIGIRNGTITAIDTKPLSGKIILDVKDLVVCPGFIDVHCHSQDKEHYALKAQDGVTSVFELEVGTNDVDKWYNERKNNSLINYGVGIGHIQVRMKIYNHSPAFLPKADSPAAIQQATDDDLEKIKNEIEFGIKRGAMALGFGIHYTPGASRWEIIECFRLVKKYNISAHVHMRYFGAQEVDGSMAALEEIIAVCVCTGATTHICHIHSTSLTATSKNLQLISEAYSNGINITTEYYPYTAGCSSIDSFIFDGNWREQLNIDYKDLQYVSTGERLTRETFEKYHQIGGSVIIYSIPEQAVDDCIKHPLAFMASDALKGHPRAAGSCARILGHYVRERNIISLMEAIKQMTLMPARQLESASSQMKKKGRISIDADADICVFDPRTIHDQATYEQPTIPSSGIQHVLVNGVVILQDKCLKNNVTPGCAIRGPLSD